MRPGVGPDGSELCWETCSQFSSVQFSHSVVSDSLQPHGLQHARPPCPSPTPRVHSNSCPVVESVMPSSHLILCRPLLLLPPIPPSIRVFSNESTLCMRWPLKYWSFSFSISPSNEHPGLISFRMDWLDLLAVQGTLKSLLQHHSSKASILLYAAFFIVQFSHLYMTTGKIIALTRQTFVGKVMSLLFNMLSRLVITFLPRSKPYDSTIPLLGLYPKELNTGSQRGICIPMFTAALLMIIKRQKQPKCPLTEKLINRIQYNMHNRILFRLKWKGNSDPRTTRMNLEDTTLSEIS